MSAIDGNIGAFTRRAQSRLVVEKNSHKRDNLLHEKEI